MDVPILTSLNETNETGLDLVLPDGFRASVYEAIGGHKL